MSVYKKLMDARLELQSIQIKKSGFNKFSGYDYFELGDFLPKVQEIFAKNELCGVVSYGIEIAKLTIVDTTDGQSIEITSPMSTAALKGCHAVQQLGAVQTYLRRYLWSTALELVEHDAVENTKAVEKKQTSAPLIPASPRNEDLDVSDEDLKYLNELAQELTALCREDPAQALATVRAAGLESDQQIALSNMLDSKTRSALKKAKEIEKIQSIAMDNLTTN
jgi:hypothetical protein